jgi:hypothetical protein
MPIWSHGTPDKFTIHVQQALTAIKAKGLQENYKKLAQAKKECAENLEEAVLNRDLAEGEVKDDSALTPAVDKATEAQTKAKSVVVHVPNLAFQPYSNLLLEKARQSWSKILMERIDCSPWKDLWGNVHNTPRSKIWDSFMECVIFHLLTVQ